MMRNVKLILAASLLLAASVADADKQSDFKDAAGATGCDGIPYSDLRSTCKSEQSYVHEYCDGNKGPISCGSESITRQVRDNLERERKSVETLKEKKRSLEDQKSRATDDQEKDRLSKEIDQADRDKYEESKRAHELVITDKTNARDTCRNSRP